MAAAGGRSLPLHGIVAGAWRLILPGVLSLLGACAAPGAGAPAPASAADKPSPAAVADAPPLASRTWADEVLYFVLIDRFADGDPANNRGVDRRNPGGWHGGDLKGLAAQLDELKSLGVTALWINPVQLQQARGMPAQAPGAGSFVHEPFHGYWIADFTQMEPHFGNEDDLKRLVDEAHRRGIKVLLDVVVNHAGYTSAYTARRTAAGVPWLRVGEGNCDANPVTCAVGGLPDFRTDLPEVRDHLIDANIALARRAGVDGFRLDTYKHVESAVWQEHRRRTRAELGPGFFLLAEDWGGTAQSLDAFFQRDEVDAGFDFSFKGSCEGWVTGRGRSVAYAAYLRSRHQVRAGYVLAHYLSSHDEPMMLANLQGDRQRFALCVALQMTSLGMPVVYYGEEVARGGHEWPFNRNDMPWGGRDILPGRGVPRDEAMREHYRRLIRIRLAHPALRRGDYTMLTQPADRVLAFMRRDAASGDAVIVLANRDDEALAADVALPPAWAAPAARDRLSGEAATVGQGRLRMTLPPKSVRIIVPADR
ncbi:MAG: alpha-glucosidase C-terminal domain-containing protein [Rubrivivax sp.]|nr:alpha-glucosidase C-terminal domain-containing protein [Rubrivivax sp.]